MLRENLQNVPVLMMYGCLSVCSELIYDTSLVGEEFIGASLSEPHTSRTALLICVCMFACLLARLLACLRLYTVNFKWAHFKFLYY